MLRRIVVFGSKIKPRLNDSNISTQHIPILLAQHLQAPAKRLQHLNPTYCNIVRHNMLQAFGHHFARCCELKIKLACMPRYNIVARTWPNDYNMQHPKIVAWKMWPFSNSQHVAIRCNKVAKRTQPVAPNNVAMCCIEMLRSLGRGFCLPFFVCLFVRIKR